MKDNILSISGKAFQKFILYAFRLVHSYLRDFAGIVDIVEGSTVSRPCRQFWTVNGREAIMRISAHDNIEQLRHKLRLKGYLLIRDRIRAVIDAIASASSQSSRCLTAERP